MNRYKVRIRGAIPWRGEKRCLMEISVGQDYHEGDKLRATVRWINGHFSQVHICLGDTLHRHNLMFERCEDETRAAIESRLIGDAWLVRNAEILQGFTIPLSLSRWNDWLAAPRFAFTRSAIQQIFETQPCFKEAVLTDANRFISSKLRQGVLVNSHDFALRKCVDLILEEIAGLALAFEEHGPIDLYPGMQFESLRLLRSDASLGAPRHLHISRFVRIEFRKLASFGPENTDEVTSKTAVGE